MVDQDSAATATDVASAKGFTVRTQVRTALGGFSPNQKRALAVMTVIALVFGAYFLRGYLELMAIAAVLAYLFKPLYNRCSRRWNSGVAGLLTLLSTIAIVVIPLSIIITMAGIQIQQMIHTISGWMRQTDMTTLGSRILEAVNAAIDRIPYVNYQLTVQDVQHAIATVATNAGELVLAAAKSGVSSIAGVATSILIFLYVYLALLSNGGRLVEVVRDLSPLDSEITDVYFRKTAAMVKATVGGQFIIAAAQGTLAATSIYIGGIHQGFFMFLIFLTVLSIIPLGAGIVAIPLGIGMALTGNVVGGVFVVLFHLIVTQNVDNVLRPMLIPKSARLSPALMLLAVFAGLSMFGFMGIVFGPVIMIVIVTTIDLYRAVISGAHWEDDFNQAADDSSDNEKPSLLARLKTRFSRKNAAEKDKDEVKDKGKVEAKA